MVIIADYDSDTKLVSHWTSYAYNNLALDSVVSHFEGITSDGNGGYNLAADVGAIGSLTYGAQPAFVHIERLGAGFSHIATWTDVNYQMLFYPRQIQFMKIIYWEFTCQFLIWQRLILLLQLFRLTNSCALFIDCQPSFDGWFF